MKIKVWAVLFERNGDSEPIVCPAELEIPSEEYRQLLPFWLFQAPPDSDTLREYVRRYRQADKSHVRERLNQVCSETVFETVPVHFDQTA
jgi:hypothetical protein